VAELSFKLIHHFDVFNASKFIITSPAMLFIAAHEFKRAASRAITPRLKPLRRYVMFARAGYGRSWMSRALAVS
jgi:hypothetical protein